MDLGMPLCIASTPQYSTSYMVSSSTSIGIQGIILDNLVLRREGPDLTTQNGTPDGANMGRWLVPDGTRRQPAR